jgi:hypothetical protein
LFYNLLNFGRLVVGAKCKHIWQLSDNTKEKKSRQTVNSEPVKKNPRGRPKKDSSAVVYKVRYKIPNTLLSKLDVAPLSFVSSLFLFGFQTYGLFPR